MKRNMFREEVSVNLNGISLTVNTSTDMSVELKDGTTMNHLRPTAISQLLDDIAWAVDGATLTRKVNGITYTVDTESLNSMMLVNIEQHETDVEMRLWLDKADTLKYSNYLTNVLF